MIKLAAVICVLAVLPNVFSGVAQQRKRNEIVKLLRHMKEHQPDTRQATTQMPPPASTTITTQIPEDTNSTITDNNEGTNFTGPDFACDNGEFTYSTFVCDGDNDCGDCTDEPAGMCDVPCVPGQWNHDEFACGNGGTVPGSWLCDGDNDCGDCSDEAGDDCTEECNPDYYDYPDFVCDNGNVTYSDYVCDGDNDCGDCTDEPADMCDVPCVPGQWNHDEFACGNGGSVPASWLCDGDNDCGDCSDEAGEGCEEVCDPNSEYVYNAEEPDFACDNGELTYSTFVCDGDNDCGDCTDEPADMCDVPCVPGQWNHDDISCVNGAGPFPASYACDGWNDCGDCSDETCEQHAQACPGTEQGDNFAARGGYFKKRANIASTKAHTLSNNKRTAILAEKREHERTLKNTAHFEEKRHHKGPLTLQKKSLKERRAAAGLAAALENMEIKVDVNQAIDSLGSAISSLNGRTALILNGDNVGHEFYAYNDNDFLYWIAGARPWAGPGGVAAVHKGTGWGPTMQVFVDNNNPQFIVEALKAYVYTPAKGIMPVDMSMFNAKKSLKDQATRVTAQPTPPECMVQITNAIQGHPHYQHVHNTAVNQVCDVQLSEHRDYFCGCMAAVAASTYTEQMANAVLSTHSHGVTFDMLIWEQACCCNADQTCPTENLAKKGFYYGKK